MKQVFENTSLVVVTYKRCELLQVLFDSIAANSVSPGCVYVVDNGKDTEVGEMCSALEVALRAGQLAETQVEQAVEQRPEQQVSASHPRVIWIPMETNTGGAGGFSRGVLQAYEDGAEWIWVMDDDVRLLPHALETLRPWMDTAVESNRRVIQCRRLNFDNSLFYWQYHFLYHLGIPNPISPSRFDAGETWRPMNTACFEGGLFHRSIVGAIGAPDNRFFIYWDDTIYGYLASKHTQPILISDVLMQRMRHIDHLKVGYIRKLNDTSDMVRYYIMRNRGYMARYTQLYGEYNAFVWGLGTCLTFAKEFIRLFIARNFSSGLKQLRQGMKDARAAFKDPTWHPMPPLS